MFIQQRHVELADVDGLDVAPEDPGQNPADQALQNGDGSAKSRQKKTKQNKTQLCGERTDRLFILLAVDLKRQN